MNQDDFYAECSTLLGTEGEGNAFTHYKRTRWNNRVAGRGRFPGHGTIRAFGDLVRINLHTPRRIDATIEGRDKALDFLRAELS